MAPETARTATTRARVAVALGGANRLKLRKITTSQETIPAPPQATLRKRIVSLFVRRGLLDKAEGEAMRRCEHGGGFSLDANVRIEAHDRQGLERRLRRRERHSSHLTI